MSKRRVHYVLSSHWDREWFQSFQDYRYRLVQLMDHVLDSLDSGTLKGPFTTDGQIVVLEDYLAIRPERRGAVEAYLKSGLIVSGPWYNLPDEFLVSGESLVRNLRLGRRMARDMGAEPSNAGWFCDLFGHNSQMPQILAGFGVKGGFLWRGVNDMSAAQRWEGADGTSVVCYKFGATGYCTYAFRVRGAEAEAVEGLPGSPNRVLVENEEQIAANLVTYIREEAKRVQSGPILLFDGGDHQGFDERVYGVLTRYLQNENTELARDFEIVHSSLDAYLEELEAETAALPVTLRGELREPGEWALEKDQQWVIPGVLSSRVWIKQENAHCQSLLTQWAEPLASFAHRALGENYPTSYLDLSWKWLITNHPHDSICGCSIDIVHQDMKYRFSQSRQIADRQAIEAGNCLAAAIPGDVAADELRVVVFNPLPRPRSETVELTLQIPTAWPKFAEFFGFETKSAFRTYDSAGTEVPYQRLGQSGGYHIFIDPIKMPQGYQTNEVKVSLPLDLPALGYTTLTVKSAPDESTRYPAAIGLATSERSMANEYLSVTIESNGTLTLTDKRGGKIYSRLLTFEDCADIGDGWYHGQAVNDRAHVSTGERSEVSLVHNGPYLTTFRVKTRFAVPAEFDFARMVRSEASTEIVLDSTLSLRPGSDRLEIETVVNNTARDHRLRVLLPSGATTDTYSSDTPFDAVRRPIALRADNHLYREMEVEGKPQQSWTAVSDAERGLAVVCDGGLLECAVRDLPERPLALTFFRSTRRTVFTGGEPDGQVQGVHRFRYDIVPLQGAPDAVRLAEIGQQLAGGLRCTQMETRHLKLARRGRADAAALPATGSFLEVRGPLLLAAAQELEGGLEVRLFNPTDSAAQGELCVGAFAPREAYWVDLESRLVGLPLTVNNGTIAVTLPPHGIGTVRLS